MKRWLGVHDFAVAVHARNANIDKTAFAKQIAEHYGLQEARSVYFADDVAIRFCYSNNAGFSNCVVSLSTLKKFDDRPFLVSLLQPSGVQTFLANSTLIRKVSHSSQKLAMDKIRGTILGHDIIRDLNGVPNRPEQFAALFETHQTFAWSDNLARLVAATTSISPKGLRFEPSEAELARICRSPETSARAEREGHIAAREQQLVAQLTVHRQKILELAAIDNVNLRGNAIEQLLTGVGNLHFLGDRVFEEPGDLRLVVDLKTKLLGLSSSPKLYNIDKMLKELATTDTVFCVFFIGIDVVSATVVGRLIDVLDTAMIDATTVQFHWAGRASRGVTQLSSSASALLRPDFVRKIDVEKAGRFIERLLRAGSDATAVT